MAFSPLCALPAGCRWVLVKEGEEAPSGSVRQNTDRDLQALRRATSYSTQLDVAMGSSGEGSRLQGLVRPAGP